MKSTITLWTVLSLLILTVSISFGQNATSDDVLPVIKQKTMLQTGTQVPKTGTYYTQGKSILLYDNGPIVNFPGSGGAPDTSRLQSTSLTMNTIGAGHQVTAKNRVADDVVITDSAWIIDSIVFFAYQTGSSNTSTINHVNLRIWNNIPDSNISTLIWGDSTTNRLIRSVWSHIYRNTETAPTDVTRPVMRDVVATPGLALPMGTYYIDWQTGGTLTSGPWVPPITINGQTTTGDGWQRTAMKWRYLLDTGTGTGQGLPFMIYGTVGSIPTTPDIGVNAVVAPTSGNLTSSETVTVSVHNYSFPNASNYSIKYRVDGGTVVSEVNSGTLGALASQNYTFTTPADLSVPGSHTIKTWTEFAGDINHGNDTAQVTITNYSAIGENATYGYLSIYPNPSSDLINVTSGSAIQNFQITDMLGSVVYADYASGKEFSFSVNGWAKGIYTLRIQNSFSVSCIRFIVD